VSALRFAVLGDPVAHSKSPAMHAAAFRALGLPHRYEAIQVREDALGGWVAKLRSGAYEGFNVTVPHKRAILAHVDVLDPCAALVGAANALVRDEGGRVGAHNTDVTAIAEELRALAPDVAPPSAAGLVLGSGGAARSAIVALARGLGLRRIVVRARRDATALVRELEPALRRAGYDVSLEAQALEPHPATEREVAYVVQATSAGMHGAEPGGAVAAAVAWAALPARAAALDVVYAPPDTPFLGLAWEHGIRATGGLGMLARQGALALELWLRVPAPYGAMLSALI
jgi:shikimate dehydrogenase